MIAVLKWVAGHCCRNTSCAFSFDIIVPGWQRVLLIIQLANSLYASSFLTFLPLGVEGTVSGSCPAMRETVDGL